ncbi:hypothetical protein HY994_06425 [Candidatus Micrarchaeota archaeon]|nr:hypothetical protein [Candidatus Micrarchaeota archaeon]
MKIFSNLAFSVLIAGLFFSALVLAAPVTVSFQKTFMESTYSVIDFFVLEKIPTGYAAAKPSLEDDVKYLKTERSDSEKFPKRATLAWTDSSSGKIFIQIKVNSRKIWLESTKEKWTDLSLDSAFQKANPRLIPLFRLPAYSLPRPPGSTADEYPTVGWVFTHQPPLKVFVGIKGIAYDPDTYSRFVEDVSEAEKIPRGNLRTSFSESVTVKPLGDIRSNLVERKADNVIYKSVTEDVQNPADFGDEPVQWYGRSPDGEPVPNGDYVIILTTFHQVAAEEKPSWSNQPERFVEGPVHVAGEPTQVGQYLLKKGDKLQFQDYYFTVKSVASDGLAELRVEQIDTFKKTTLPVPVGLYDPQTQTGKVKPGIMEPKMPSSETAVRFMTSALDLKHVPEELKARYKEKTAQYVVLTVMQTRAIERAAEAKQKPEKDTRTSVPTGGKPLIDPETIRIYQSPQSANKRMVYVAFAIDQAELKKHRGGITVEFTSQGRLPFRRNLDTTTHRQNGLYIYPVDANPPAQTGTYGLKIKVYDGYTGIQRQLEEHEASGQITGKQSPEKIAPPTQPAPRPIASTAQTTSELKACEGNLTVEDRFQTREYYFNKYGQPVPYRSIAYIGKAGECRTTCGSAFVLDTVGGIPCSGGQLCCDLGNAAKDTRVTNNYNFGALVNRCIPTPNEGPVSKVVCEARDRYCIWPAGFIRENKCTPSQDALKEAEKQNQDVDALKSTLGSYCYEFRNNKIGCESFSKTFIENVNLNGVIPCTYTPPMSECRALPADRKVLGQP